MEISWDNNKVVGGNGCSSGNANDQAEKSEIAWPGFGSDSDQMAADDADGDNADQEDDIDEDDDEDDEEDDLSQDDEQTSNSRGRTRRRSSVKGKEGLNANQMYNGRSATGAVNNRDDSLDSNFDSVSSQQSGCEGDLNAGSSMQASSKRKPASARKRKRSKRRKNNQSNGNVTINNNASSNG